MSFTRLVFAESSYHNSARICLAIAVGVFQVQQVGGCANEQTTIPARDRCGIVQLVGEHGSLIVAAVTVRIGKQMDASGLLEVLDCIAIVFRQLGHVDPAVLIKVDGGRVVDERFAGNQLDLEITVQFDQFTRFFRPAGWHPFEVRCLLIDRGYFGNGIGVLGDRPCPADGNQNDNRGDDRREKESHEMYGPSGVD